MIFSRRKLARRYRTMLLHRAASRADVLFLHIAKTAGNSLRDVLDEDAERVGRQRFLKMRHGESLEALRTRFPRARIGFFVREPAARFVSGFLSRLRQGRPRNDNPWNPAEQEIFKLFHSAGELVDGIGRGDADALNAVRTIGHLRMGLAAYLGSPALLETQRGAIAFIGVTEDFDAEIERMKAMFGIDPAVQPPSDGARAHRNPDPGAGRLDARQTDVLKEFLSADYLVYSWCLAERERTLGTGGQDLSRTIA